MNIVYRRLKKYLPVNQICASQHWHAETDCDLNFRVTSVTHGLIFK